MGPVEPPGFRFERGKEERGNGFCFRKKDGPEPFETRKRNPPREMRDLPFANLKVWLTLLIPWCNTDKRVIIKSDQVGERGKKRKRDWIRTRESFTFHSVDRLFTVHASSFTFIIHLRWGPSVIIYIIDWFQFWFIVKDMEIMIQSLFLLVDWKVPFPI